MKNMEQAFICLLSAFNADTQLGSHSNWFKIYAWEEFTKISQNREEQQTTNILVDIMFKENRLTSFQVYKSLF